MTGSENMQTSPAKPSKAEDTRQRRAEALRANLRRRKAAATGTGERRVDTGSVEAKVVEARPIED